MQLENKGDNGQYTDLANIVVAFAFFGIPVIGWLLDKKAGGEWMRICNCSVDCFDGDKR